MSGRPLTPFGWFFRLWRTERPHFVASQRSAAHPHPWPEGFDPQRNPVFAHNAKDLPGVTPAQVFDTLTDARAWPSYYANAQDPELPGDKLTPGSAFAFTTFATRQRCRVVEFEPGRLLAWEARMPGNAAYHRWILEPTPGGTRIITEECNFGPLAFLNPVMSPAMHASHELWLRGLAQRWRA